MRRSYFWLSDNQFARLAPHLPIDTRGVLRVNDRRVISGIVHVLNVGRVADCTAADALLEQMPAASILHPEKGYDSNAVRRKIEARGAAPNIPPKTNRRWKTCFSPRFYRDRNAIERMLGRIRDLCRIATRYDRLASIFLAAVCLVAIVCYWS